jgi:hypothetical protein
MFAVVKQSVGYCIFSLCFIDLSYHDAYVDVSVDAVDPFFALALGAPL